MMIVECRMKEFCRLYLIKKLVIQKQQVKLDVGAAFSRKVLCFG